jgi:OmpA-OmpF porin, OOP family
MNLYQRVRAGLAVAGLALLSGHGAMAESEGFYFGLSGGLAIPDLPSKRSFDAGLPGMAFTSSLDDTSEAWGVDVGYRWNRYIAMQVGYVDLGTTEYAADFTGTTERLSYRYTSSGPTLAVLGTMPLGQRLALHGRAGLFVSDTRVRVRLEDRASGDFLSFEGNASTARDLVAAVGATWNISESYSLRGEYARMFDVGDADQTGELDVDLLSFSVLFR